MLTTHRPLARSRSTCRKSSASPRVRSLLAAPASSLPRVPFCAPLSCETFRLEPATRRFVWSFAPMPTSYHRVEHQNGSGPPPVFPPASASAGIVHRLSGLTATTYRSPPAQVFYHLRLAVAENSLVRVSIRVRVLGFFHIFAISPPKWRLFIFPSRYLCAIGLTTVFSLGCFYHPFALHYQAVLLFPHVLLRGYHPITPHFPESYLQLHHNALKLTTGTLPCSVAPTTGIRVRFFS